MTPLPKTYKVAVFEKKDAPLTIKDVELKQPSQGEVLVKVKAVGVCHSDAGVQAGAFGNSFPIIPGHEIVGDIAAVPDTEKRWKVGDRVGGPWHGGHDAVCKQCQRGQFQMCQNGAVNGVSRDGGYGEYVLLRTEAVVNVPKDVDPVEIAPILCAGITVFNSIRKLKITPGDIVAVQGLGGLGHLAVQYANKMGYRVVALSSGDKKKDFAHKLGAHEYINTSEDDPAKKLMEMGGASLIVCTAPNPKAISPLTGGLEPGGKLLVLSPCGMVEVNSIDLIVKAVSVCGFPSGHALDSEEAIAFTKLHDIHCMVEKFPLKDAQKAFDHMLSGEVRFRSVLVMN
ncbi:putative alcohol dehydrogenase [Mollisia scopiformis]|uniref:Putative alcohol dehydrogenase n=1 Tax=Mollisia scopiformis TaxID=149040 RepID=A0A194XVX0_MOLSC|nr:putative alcohol dehydrogenase [Mollisia scopiformis]KUJ24455.1 putative alcohol dehydrogenase [Mollisia scopiformis]